MLRYHPSFETIHGIRRAAAEGLLALTCVPTALAKLEAELAAFDIRAYRNGRARMLRERADGIDATLSVVRPALAKAEELLGKITITPASLEEARVAMERSQHLAPPPRRPGAVRRSVSPEDER